MTTTFHSYAVRLAKELKHSLVPAMSDRTIFGLNIDHESKIRYSTQVRPISYLKANAAEVLLNIAERREPMVITQNGEAKAVIQDVASFEQTQETLALLKLLTPAAQDIEAVRSKPARAVIERLRSKASDHK